MNAVYNVCMAAGRPPAFTDPIKLQKDIDSYFENNDRVTMSGLAVHLEVSRDTLWRYANDKKTNPKLSDIIKKGVARVMKVYEERLIYEKNQVGVIFALKNMGWSDKQELDHTSKGKRIAGFNYIPPNESGNNANNKTDA